MLKSIKKYLFKTILPYQNYTLVVLKNAVKRLVNQKRQNKYLFILGATHSGTTLMNELLSSSKNASTNNRKHTREGQLLPTVADHMFSHSQQWNEKLNLDWNFIFNEWRKYWDTTKPILIEKSPPNLLRAFSIEKVFTPSYFVIFVRDPYAHCETFIRKNKYSATESARFIINTLKYQKRNLELLKNTILISYEVVVEKPDIFKDEIASFIPQLSDLRIEGEFKAHNYYNNPQPLKNFNAEKIARLKKSEIEEINEVFNSEKKLIEFFGYNLLKTNRLEVTKTPCSQN